MTVNLVNPPGLPVIDVYRHVSVATGSRLIHVAGQVSWDADGEPVGDGDLAAQVEQCYVNVATALAGVGAGFDDVVKLTFHVVDWAPEKMTQFMEGVSRARARLGITAAPPASLFGIVALDVPEHLVELEATAVLD